MIVLRQEPDWGEVWEILNMDVKPYPCCRSVHCMIDAMFQIREEMEKEGRSAADIKQVEIATYQVGYQQCAVSKGCLEPQSPMDAQIFCSPTELRRLCSLEKSPGGVRAGGGVKSAAQGVDEKDFRGAGRGVDEGVPCTLGLPGKGGVFRWKEDGGKGSGPVRKFQKSIVPKAAGG